MTRWQQLKPLKSSLTQTLTNRLREEPRDDLWIAVDPDTESVPWDNLYGPLDDNHFTDLKRATWRIVHDDISWRALTEL